MSLKVHTPEQSRPAQAFSFGLSKELVGRLKLVGDVKNVSSRRGWSAHKLGNALVVVLDGVVVARHESEPSTRVVELLFPGDVVGETLDAGSAGVTILGLGNARVVVLDGGAVDELIKSIPSTVSWLASALSLRLRRAENRQLNLMTLDARTRVSAYLGEWFRVAGTRHLRSNLDGGLSQLVLGDAVGVNRATVNREFQALMLRGVLDVRGRDVIMLDAIELARHGRGAFPYLLNVTPRSRNQLQVHGSDRVRSA